MPVSRTLRAILGEDPFEQKRKEIVAQKQALESQVHQAVLDILSQEVPGEEPEEIYKKHRALANVVEKRVAEYYGAAYSQQLEFLQRLEAAS